MQDNMITMEAGSEAAARMWAAAAEQSGAVARHVPGMRLELVFPTQHAKDQFASILDLTVQTLARRPGHA